MNIEISERLDEIDHTIDKLQENMKEIWKLLSEMKSDLARDCEKSDSDKHTKRKNKIIVIDDRSNWKKKIYEQIKILTGMKRTFRKRTDVLHYIYNYMRKNYGIVWEQDIKEYKEHYKLEYKPKTIDVVYDNKMYKSIFEAILIDMISNTQDGLNQNSSRLIEM